VFNIIGVVGVVDCLMMAIVVSWCWQLFHGVVMVLRWVCLGCGGSVVVEFVVVLLS